MDDVDERVRGLESRLRRVEDELEIIRLLSSYGPLADRGAARAAADLWAAGGGYEFGASDGSSTRLRAPDELAGLYRSEPHVSMVRAGVAHLTATPRVIVTGDRAEAVGYSFVILAEGDRWYLNRSAVNHWSLERGPSGWRIRERSNRPLDGSPQSHALMRRTFDIPG